MGYMQVLDLVLTQCLSIYDKYAHSPSFTFSSLQEAKVPDHWSELWVQRCRTVLRRRVGRGFLAGRVAAHLATTITDGKTRPGQSTEREWCFIRLIVLSFSFTCFLHIRHIRFSKHTHSQNTCSFNQTQPNLFQCLDIYTHTWLHYTFKHAYMEPHTNSSIQIFWNHTHLFIHLQ